MAFTMKKRDILAGFSASPQGPVRPAKIEGPPCNGANAASGHGVDSHPASHLIVHVLLLVGLYASTGWAGCKEESFAGRFFLPDAVAAESDATIRYFGHSFFQIVTRRGTSIITDPLAPGWYPPPDLSADVVTIGREHMNHNWVPLVRGKPSVLRGLIDTDGEWDWRKIRTQVGDALIYSVPIYNVRRNGGMIKGAAFVFDLAALCIVHLGDLSHKLSPQLLRAIGKPDIALIPIGGGTTMDAETAQEVVRQLKPKIAIPMHYRDDLSRVRRFASGFPVQYLPGNLLDARKSALPEKTQIVVLKYPGGP